MSSQSLILHDKIWLDKPKYDAAERRFYEKATKITDAAGNSRKSDSSSSPESSSNKKKKVSKSMNNSSDTNKQAPKASDEVLKVEDIPSEVTDANICPLKHDLWNLEMKNLIPKSAPISGLDINDSDYPPLSISMKELENACPISQNKEEVCFKQEKSKDNNFSKGTSNKKNEICDVSCNKAKKPVKMKIIDDIIAKQEVKSGIDPVSEVVKLKGFYLQSKNLSYQPDSLQNKGTNVNTIPQITKITPTFEKTKNIQNMKKSSVIYNPTPKNQDSVDFVPADTGNDPLGDEQVKKEEPKKKKKKKERHRDKKGVTQNNNSWNSLAGEVAKARQHIKNSLQCIENIAVTSNEVSAEITNRLSSLEKENQVLKARVSELTALLEKMEMRVSSVEKSVIAGPKPSQSKAPAPAPPKKDDAEDDDGVDLFGSDSEEEDAEAAKLKEQRLAEYAARKAKKPVLIAKSSIVLDVKPWDDETNMKELEAEVRKISCDGLLWGASKLVPLAYGIHKLQISCVVEDEKVSVDWLQEVIQEIEDYVQSVDIAAFNKV